MSGSATVTRSSTGTGAVRCERPTTSTLMHSPRLPEPSGSRSRANHHPVHTQSVHRVAGGLVRASRDVERQDLHLDRQVNLAHLDVVWNLENNWCEVQNALDACRYQTVAD